MDALAGLTFRDTRFLWLLALAPAVVVWLLWREQVRVDAARRLVSERLRGSENTVRFVRPWLLALALVAGTIALAGPQYGWRTMPVNVAESNRYFVLDVSSSMDARDTGASRLDLGRSLLQQLIAGESGRVGLVIFEKDASIVSPLTTDTSAVVSLLETVRSGETDSPGSDIGNAVLAALRNSDTATGEAIDIVLVSDGEDQGKGISTAVAESKRRGVRVHTVLLGTKEGATIPSEFGPLQDENGREIVTKASGDTLRQLSAATGGRFVENPLSSHAISSMQETLRGAAATRAERELRVPLERFEWPLGAALAALLLAALVNRGAL